MMRSTTLRRAERGRNKGRERSRGAVHRQPGGAAETQEGDEKATSQEYEAAASAEDEPQSPQSSCVDGVGDLISSKKINALSRRQSRPQRSLKPGLD